MRTGWANQSGLGDPTFTACSLEKNTCQSESSDIIIHFWDGIQTYIYIYIYQTTTQFRTRIKAAAMFQHVSTVPSIHSSNSKTLRCHQTWQWNALLLNPLTIIVIVPKNSQKLQTAGDSDAETSKTQAPFCSFQ